MTNNNNNKYTKFLLHTYIKTCNKKKHSFALLKRGYIYIYLRILKNYKEDHALDQLVFAHI